jgi:hypothetical protein
MGLIFGLPSLRVKGFTSVATLAAQFIIPWLSRNTFEEYLVARRALRSLCR